MLRYLQLNLINKLLLLLLDEEKPARNYQASEDEIIYFHNLQLLTAKPVLYVCNTDEETLPKINTFLSLLQQHKTKHFTNDPLSLPIKQRKLQPSSPSEQFTSPVESLKTIVNTYPTLLWLPICANIEAQISSLDSEEDKHNFLSTLGWEEDGLSRLIKNSYSLLNLITFFTSGKKETRAWTVPKGTKAHQAAGKIHSDFEKGFIKAEVYSYKNLKTYGSESALKASGHYKQEGKNYVIQDGDVILFRFNV